MLSRPQLPNAKSVGLLCTSYFLYYTRGTRGNLYGKSAISSRNTFECLPDKVLYLPFLAYWCPLCTSATISRILYPENKIKILLIVEIHREKVLNQIWTFSLLAMLVCNLGAFFCFYFFIFQTILAAWVLKIGWRFRVDTTANSANTMIQTPLGKMKLFQ